MITRSFEKTEINLKMVTKIKFKLEDRDKDIIIMGVIAILSILITRIVFWNHNLLVW